MSFAFSIGSRYPISEIANSHVYRLEKTRNEDDLKLRVFLIKKSEDTVPYILSVKWLSDCSEVGDHEIYQEYLQVTPFYNLN